MSLLPTLFYHDFFPLTHEMTTTFPSVDLLLKSADPVENRQLKLKSKKSSHSKLTDDMKSILQVDLLENETEFQVHADLPGVEEKDLDISVENNHLVIKGHREKKIEMKNATEHRLERSFGSVQRAIRLPPNADQSSCKAHFENGVLRISLAKIAPPPPANKIKITKKKKVNPEGNDGAAQEPESKKMRAE
jgi:HSP20 family molecular chaperone IbpA